MLSRILAAVVFSLTAVALPSFAYAQQAATAARQDTGNTALAALNTVFGLKTDPKSTATDSTSITWMQVQKQISASAQAIAAFAAGAATEATLAGSFHLNASNIPQVEVTDSTGASLDLSRPDTVTRTTTAVSTSAFNGVAALATARVVYLKNTSTGSVYCNYGSTDPTAGTLGNSDFEIPSGRTYSTELDEWAGAVRCIGAAANGNIRAAQLSNS